MADFLQKNSKYKKIKDLLTEKKITFEQFSQMIDVSRPTITNWFQGKSKIDIDLIELIAKKLGVSVLYFFQDSYVKDLQPESKSEKLQEELLIEKNARIKLLEEKIQLLEDKIKLLEEIKKTAVLNAECVDVLDKR